MAGRSQMTGPRSLRFDLSDVADPNVMELLRTSPEYIIEHVLHPAIMQEQTIGVLPDTDVDTWGLRNNITEFPFMPCRIVAMNIDAASAIHTELLTRSKETPITTERTPLLTSINSVVQIIDDLNAAGITGIPVCRIYVGAQIVDRVNLSTRRWAIHPHQPNSATLVTMPPWRLPVFVINGRAELMQPVYRARNICRALISPYTLDDIVHTREQPPYGGIYVVGHALDLDVLLRCFDFAYGKPSETFARCFGIEALTKIRALVVHQDVIKKYARLTPARTIKEASAMVTSGALTFSEFITLQMYDVLLDVTGTIHDSPSGTVPACAHIVMHTSGTRYNSALLKQINMAPAVVHEAYRKPSSAPASSQCSPTDARACADRFNDLMKRANM